MIVPQSVCGSPQTANFPAPSQWWSGLNLTVTFCQHMQARAARAKQRSVLKGVCKPPPKARAALWGGRGGLQG